jgi:hypothetical protein
MIVMCSTCGQPMEGNSCTDTSAWPWDTAEPCRDCGTPPIGNHHPGCCVALCRECDDQLLFCDHGPEPVQPQPGDRHAS